MNSVMNSIDYSVNMGYNDFRTQIMTVEDLLYRFDETDATTSVSLFRRPTLAQSSRIIESVLLGMPQPMLYIDDTNSEWIVIEGAEHMFAYYAFCKNDLELVSLYFKKKQYEGLRFLDLSPLAQSNILNTKITVNVLNPGLTSHERFGIYLCLKSRIDATSLQWCRIKIFGKQYQWVRNLARDISKSRRTESMESMICYMLVGKYYDMFQGRRDRAPIDGAANLLLEKIYNGEYEGGIADDFGELLRDYYPKEQNYILNPKMDALYLSVLYHLNDRSNLRRFNRYFSEERRNHYNILRKDDSVEVFCYLIEKILKTIG